MKIYTISSGTYNTRSYKTKEYKAGKPALKFVKSIGYPFDELINFSWSHNGAQYTLTIYLI